MISRGSFSRPIAAALAVALQLSMVPVLAGTSPASLTGRIVSSSTQAPLAGVRVHVGDPKTNELRTSAPTRADGTFAVAGLPPASYQVAVESSGGLYVVETPVRLGPGEKRTVQLAIDPQTAPAPDEKEKKKKTGTTVWNNPLTATLIVVGAAIVVGVIVDNVTGSDNTSNNNPSPSMP